MHVEFEMDGDPTHENLAIAFNEMVALEIMDVLKAEDIPYYEAQNLADSATFALAILFDQNSIVVNGKRYQPRVCFVAEDGDVLPGAAGFGHLHEYAAGALDSAKDLKVVK